MVFEAKICSFRVAMFVGVAVSDRVDLAIAY